jgi:antitoxin component YwqK of YwqJK toxin-antitoxin module
MNVLSWNRVVRSAISIVFAVSGSLVCHRLAAQDAATKAATNDSSTVKSVEERVKIQPYTGPPIYLDQPEEVAPPTIVRRDTKTEKYKDGTVQAERQLALFSDNHFEADGFYREFYPSGKPFLSGEYRRGRQHGEWTYWFENGQVNRKATYKNGQPDGAWEVFRADGTLSAKRGFKDGQRHGEWMAYDKTGKQPLQVEHYDSGKLDGDAKVWFPNGQLKSEAHFKQGLRSGVSTEWTEKGEKRGEVSYVDGKLDGTATVWLPDGRKIVQQYKAGRLLSESKQ